MANVKYWYTYWANVTLCGFPKPIGFPGPGLQNLLAFQPVTWLKLEDAKPHVDIYLQLRSSIHTSWSCEALPPVVRQPADSVGVNQDLLPRRDFWALAMPYMCGAQSKAHPSHALASKSLRGLAGTAFICIAQIGAII